MISQREFLQRRQRILSAMVPDSVMIVAAVDHAVRNRDVEYPYHPEADFFYLTGFDEPDAILVLRREGRKREQILFCRERDPEVEQWSGERMGTERAREQLKLSAAWPIEKWQEQLSSLLQGVSDLYLNLGEESAVERAVLQQIKALRQRSRAGVKFPQSIHSTDPLLHEQRLRKSPAELKMMQRAAEITVAGHRRAMQACRPEMVEQELEGEILHEFSRQGSRTVAYDSIVGGGNNACTLHYIRNSDPLQDGDLVLIDAGAEWQGYAADITRTFPVNGRFSTPQRQLYEIVLAAQKAAITQVRPGRRWDAPHRAAVRVITQGLIDLKILKGDLKQLIREEKYRRFYMHQTGHWLGMDVHDVGTYKIDGKWRLLEPGMVLTIEPGLYIPQGTKGVAKKWHGIGIRIEDDVVVTETYHQVLTEGAPKEVEEIEQWMGGW